MAFEQKSARVLPATFSLIGLCETCATYFYVISLLLFAIVLPEIKMTRLKTLTELLGCYIILYQLAKKTTCEVGFENFFFLT